MKPQNILTTLLTSSLLFSGLYAEESKATKQLTHKEPVVGGSVVGIAAAEVETTGYRASQLIGSAVFNEKGKKIGNIDDFILSHDGKLTTAIISVGGFLGIGGRLVAVPAKFIHGNEKDQIVISNTSRKKLQALPAFIYKGL